MASGARGRWLISAWESQVGEDFTFELKRKRRPVAPRLSIRPEGHGLVPDRHTGPGCGSVPVWDVQEAAEQCSSLITDVPISPAPFLSEENNVKENQSFQREG